MNGHADLRIVSVATLICALLSPLLPLESLSAVLAIPLCLLLPGYAIVAAAFAPHPLDPWRLIVLVLGMSLVALALGSLVLNYVPGGIRAASWAVLLALLVVACCRLAAVRRGPAATARPRWSVVLGRRDAAFLSAALLVGAAAIVLAETPVPADKAVGFTGLWMLPAPGPDDRVEVGVQSSEQRPYRFALEFRVGDLSQPKRNFRLEPGQSRRFTYPIGTPGARGRVRAVATLIRLDRFREVYRRVTSWLPASGRVRP